jgi:hypothetical protein
MLNHPGGDPAIRENRNAGDISLEASGVQSGDVDAYTPKLRFDVLLNHRW